MACCLRVSKYSSSFASALFCRNSTCILSAMLRILSVTAATALFSLGSLYSWTSFSADFVLQKKKKKKDQQPSGTLELDKRGTINNLRANQVHGQSQGHLIPAQSPLELADVVATCQPSRLFICFGHSRSVEHGYAPLEFIDQIQAAVEDAGCLFRQERREGSGIVAEQFENALEGVQLGRDGIQLGPRFAHFAYKLVEGQRRPGNGIACSKATAVCGSVVVAVIMLSARNSETLHCEGAYIQCDLGSPPRLCWDSICMACAKKKYCCQTEREKGKKKEKRESV